MIIIFEFWISLFHSFESDIYIKLFYASTLIFFTSENKLKSFEFIFIFILDTESWHLLSQGRVLPPARHKHSAIIHDDVMWVYGGMTDLHERSDLWRFDFGWYL